MALEDVAAVAEPVEVEEVVETSEAVEPESAEEHEPVEQHEEEVALDFRKVPAELRDFFKSAEGKQAKAAWYERQAFREAFADGPKAATELLSKLESYGGLQGVETKFQQLQESADKLQQIDAKLASGDPTALDDFIAQSPEGFTKLAPEMMNRWNKVDPDGCNRTLCGVIENTLRNGQFESLLEKASLYLEVGKPEQAMQVLQNLQAWGKSFGEAASRPVTPKQAPEVDKRIAELDQRESSMYDREINSKTAEAAEPIISKEIAPYLTGRNVDAEKQEFLRQSVNSEIQSRMYADTKFQDTMRSFYKVKDTQGAVKAFRAKVAEITPDVVKKQTRIILGSPVSKPAPKVVQKAAPPVAQEETDPRKKLFSEIFNR